MSPHTSRIRQVYGLPYSHEEGWPTEPEGLMWPPIPLYDGDQIVEQPVNLSTLTARYTQKMLESLDELAKTKQPFFHLAYEFLTFLYRCHFMVRRGIRGLYGDVVEEMDRSIGIILDKLDATGLSKSTLVFFASDNGAWLNPSSGVPGFGADNDIGPFDGGSNGPLFEGKVLLTKVESVSWLRFDGPGYLWWNHFHKCSFHVRCAADVA